MKLSCIASAGGFPRLRALHSGAAVLAAAAALLACGCGRNSVPQPGTNEYAQSGYSASMPESEGYQGRPRTEFYLTEEPVAINKGDQLTIGFSQIGAESDWRLASSASMEQVFTSDNGYNLIFSNGQQKQENQIKAIREFISQDVDYIILDPLTETGWESSLQEAKDAQIPVIIVDREVRVEDEDLYSVWVGSDFRLEGDRACAWLAAWLDSQPQLKDREIGIVHLQGTLDASAQIGRSKALEDAVKQHDNWKLLDVECGDFVQAKGREVMESMIEEHGSAIQVVYCENDNMAYGALEALESAGMTAGADIAAGEVLVISFDAARQGLEDTLSGKIAVDTECNPLYAPILSRIIMALEQGTDLPKRNYYEEKQFSSIEEISEVTVNGKAYDVTQLSDDLIHARVY